jgi:DUF1680 family protein
MRERYPDIPRGAAGAVLFEAAYDAGEGPYPSDAMLGGLARWLRAAGYDARFEYGIDDADLIARVFGRAKGRMRGYCGHPEVELALVKLYRAAGERRYLELAKYFVDERGSKPYYFDLEAQTRGEKPGGGYEYCQAHTPVREQRDAEGHAVRALYLFSGMAE